MKVIKEISLQEIIHVQKMFENASIDSEQTLQILRSKDYFKNMYNYLSPEYSIVGLFNSDRLEAAVAIVTIPGATSYFVTDLFKNPLSKARNVTLKLIQFFLEKKNLWAKFNLVFVEENLNALEPVLEYASLKRGLSVNISNVFTNVFLVDGCQQECESSENLFLEIDGIRCIFYTDKKSRVFKLMGKIFARAYVEIDKATDSISTMLKIVEAGLKFAQNQGCNTFILLSDSKWNLNQNYIYFNRFLSVGNDSTDGREFILKKGILI